MTNDCVKGYILIVLKSLEYENEEIERVLDELHYAFDTTSESEAEQYFYDRKWQD